MEAYQERVKEFHEFYNLPRPDAPTLDEFTEVRCRLIEEEATELRTAFEEGNIVEIIDALADLEYVVAGGAVALGIDLEPFSKEVHRSNMTKLWNCEDCVGIGAMRVYRKNDAGNLVLVDKKECVSCQGKGKVAKYREDGKVLKAPTYSPADIARVLAELHPKVVI